MKSKKIIKKSLNNKNGMTMVNVLVAFALLLMILLMFNQAVQLALNLYVKSEDARKHTEKVYSSFYGNYEYTDEDNERYGQIDGSFLDFFENGEPAFRLNTPGVGKHAEKPDTIYFYGYRKQVNP